MLFPSIVSPGAYNLRGSNCFAKIRLRELRRIYVNPSRPALKLVADPGISPIVSIRSFPSMCCNKLLLLPVQLL